MSNGTTPVLDRAVSSPSLAQLALDNGDNALAIVPPSPSAERRVVQPQRGMVKVSDIAKYDAELVNILHTRLDFTQVLPGARLAPSDAYAVLKPLELARFDAVQQGLGWVAFPYKVAHALTALGVLGTGAAAALQDSPTDALGAVFVGAVVVGMVSAMLYGLTSADVVKPRQQQLIDRLTNLRNAGTRVPIPDAQ